MPFFNAIPRDQRLAVLANGKIKEGLTKFGEAGFVHNEVKWRHLGRLPRPGEQSAEDELNQNIYILDLGANGVEAASASFDVDKWVTSVMTELRESAGDDVDRNDFVVVGGDTKVEATGARKKPRRN